GLAGRVGRNRGHVEMISNATLRCNRCLSPDVGVDPHPADRLDRNVLEDLGEWDFEVEQRTHRTGPLPPYDPSPQPVALGWPHALAIWPCRVGAPTGGGAPPGPPEGLGTYEKPAGRATDAGQADRSPQSRPSHCAVGAGTGWPGTVLSAVGLSAYRRGVQRR